MKQTPNQDQLSPQAQRIELAARLAVRDALIDHKLKGDPIVSCEADGTVRWIQPDDIVIPDLPAETLD